MLTRGLAALALVAVAEGATTSCDHMGLAKCAVSYSRPYFPTGASSRSKQGYCDWASGYYSCAAKSDCISTNMAKDCADDFEKAGCSGVEVCMPGAISKSSKSPKEEPVAPSKPAPSVPAASAAVQDEFNYEKFPPHAPFFGFMGAAFALIFANLGAAYGTAKSGRGISTMGVVYPALIMKHIIPVVMAGVLGIYGLIIAVIIGSSVTGFKNNEPVYSGARAPDVPRASA
jgi:ATP synthase proteolipid subunit